jgi:pSer/pThr/pTyr-binding forkhead associated (FHA) protein
MNFYHLSALTLPLQFDLRGGLNSVGRNPTNDVVIHEASVSAFHAEITVDDRGVIVRDLQSTNGTFLDDQPISEHEIRSGQVIQFGSVTLRLLTDEIRITVPPTNPQPAPITARVDPDTGISLCSINPRLPATHRCVRCPRVFHEKSLRILHLSNSDTVLRFCPICSAQAEPIPGLVPPPLPPVTVLARITQTVRLVLRRKR